MAEPTILGEGATPNVHDTRWRQLVKIVGAAYNGAASSTSADNIPTTKDTRWVLLRKLNKILVDI